MTRYFTQYWANENCAYYQEHGETGKPCNHTAGEMFTARGVEKGDHVYILTVKKGRLFLIGKMRVKAILFSTKEAEALLGGDLWEASEHLIADRCTRMHFDKPVPPRTVRRLEFMNSQGISELTFVSGDELDRQTVRTVRELTPDSADALDRLLEPMKEA